MGKRVVSMWFPRFSSDRYRRRQGYPADHPLAIVREKKNTLRVCCLSVGAETAGLVHGMSLTDAKGAVPTLISASADAHDEDMALHALHRWAYQYSPSVALDGADGLLVDVTGCAHLFGGEKKLLDTAEKYLAEMGYEARLALSDSAGAARALARYSQKPFPVLVPPGESRCWLEPLPVEALEKHGVAFRRLGLKSVGEVAALPRAELTKRFGRDVADCLEETFGTRATPVSPMTPARVYAARMSFPDPIGLLDDVLNALERLLSSVCRQLEQDGRGAREVGFALWESGGAVTEMVVGLARPTTDPCVVARQFEGSLSHFNAGCGLDRLRIVVLRHESAFPRQRTTGEECLQEQGLDELLGRLGNRLGFDRITLPHPLETHLSGQDVAHNPAVAHSSAPEWPPSSAPEPLRLFDLVPVEPVIEGRPPPAFRWRGDTIRVAYSRGPRRLTGEWWHEDQNRRGVRDHWDIQTTCGYRLWMRCDLMAEGERRWFVAGQLP